MSSHDEYSDDEADSIDGTQAESQVLLGLNDGPFEDEHPNIEDTFIGGYPIWMNSSLAPDKDLTECRVCKQKMALLLQAFAPLDGKLYDRAIYVFACQNPTCLKKKGSIRAIRGVCKDPKKMAQLQQQQDEALAEAAKKQLQLEESAKRQLEMTKDLFSKADKSNPFSGNPFDSNPFSSGGNPFSKGDEKIGKSGKSGKSESLEISENTKSVQDPDRSKDKNPETVSDEPDRSFPAYPGYFVYVEQEKFKPQALEPELEKYRHLIDKEDDTQAGALSKQRTQSVAMPAEMEASSKIQSMLEDKYFQAFSETVGYNPGQVLRYELGGKPLLYNGQDDVAKKVIASTKGISTGIASPAYNPSSERHYELQIMPKAILDLEKQLAAKSTTQEYIINGMEWGTIIIATDKEDYMPQLDDHGVGYIEEWCGVQWEESV